MKQQRWCESLVSVGIILVLAGTVVAQQSKRTPFEPVQDVPNLPRVLLIGDSISIGYTLTVRDALRKVANVHRPKGNCAGTLLGVEKLDEWLGKCDWDVIHFNWGLHDLKYVDSHNALTNVDQGKQQSALPQYRKQLEQLVRRLEKTKAKLIFATTTPVPQGAKGRVPGDEGEYNAVAIEIMRDHGIEVNDLCRLAQALPDECKREANVHYTPSGSKRLGLQVASVVTKALEQRK